MGAAATVGAWLTQRRGLVAFATVMLAGGMWAYDALGFRQAAWFEAEHEQDPAAVLARWEGYCTWHPSRNLFRPGAATDEQRRLDRLRERAQGVEYERGQAALARAAADPEADAIAAWQQFVAFHNCFPNAEVRGELARVRGVLKQRRDQELDRRARPEYDRLVRAESDGVDLSRLVTLSDDFLRTHGECPLADDVRTRRTAYVRRVEEKEIDTAREHSLRQPLDFAARRELYQRYLDHHPNGLFAAEARSSLQAIAGDWDRHDFRALRDHYVEKPGEVTELVARCRGYLAAHPQGKFTAAATDLLRWSERVTAAHDYHVVLRSGRFEKRLAHFFSRGPDLSVEIEVAGVRHGPSNIVANSYNPEWNYEFSRAVRWKLGDGVRIRVVDHDYYDRVVVDLATGDDPLAMRFLAGEIWSGANRLTFESDFTFPTLPKIE